MGKIYETQTKQVQVLVGKTCDMCGCEVKLNQNMISVSYYHSAWGNDSCDSNRSYEVCNFDCYVDVLETGLKELKDYSYSAVIDDKPYEFIAELVNRLR
jgi:hypothetical protein